MDEPSLIRLYSTWWHQYCVCCKEYAYVQQNLESCNLTCWKLDQQPKWSRLYPDFLPNIKHFVLPLVCLFLRLLQSTHPWLLVFYFIFFIIFESDYHLLVLAKIHNKIIIPINNPSDCLFKHILSNSLYYKHSKKKFGQYVKWCRRGKVVPKGRSLVFSSFSW